MPNNLIYYYTICYDIYGYIIYNYKNYKVTHYYCL